MIQLGNITPSRHASTQRISSAWPSLYPVPTQRIVHVSLGRVQRIFAQEFSTPGQPSVSKDFSTK